MQFQILPLLPLVWLTFHRYPLMLSHHLHEPLQVVQLLLHTANICTHMCLHNVV